MHRSTAIIALAAFFATCAASSPSFVLDHDAFVLNGAEITLRAGCVHYARIHPSLWRDRLRRLRAMGLNTIQTYVFWNWHVQQRGEVDFEGGRDLVNFVRTAQEEGLLVLVRAGPYGCGEWDFGGFPAFLIKDNVTLRTYDEAYIELVDEWWSVLLPKLKPLLVENGGPIAMVQVENEFGSYGNVDGNPLDKKYMEHLVSVARKHLGPNVVLYTTDGGNANYMLHGSLKGDAVYTVGDFGPGSDPMVSFNAQKQFNVPGKSPNFVSEFYSGWLTHWGEQMANTSSGGLANGIDSVLQHNGSFALYMGLGGTNFEFYAGANGGGASFQPDITSYDYDSPLAEGGTHGYGSDGKDKYEAVRNTLAKWFPSPAFPAEDPSPIAVAHPSVTFHSYVTLDDALPVAFPPPITGLPSPQPMEMFDQPHGLMLYKHTLEDCPAGTLTLALNELHDYARVYINGVLEGTLFRPTGNSLTFGVPQSGTTLQIHLLVEGMGHLNYGRQMFDPKGITESVTANGTALIGDWTALRIPLDRSQISQLPFAPLSPSTASTVPAFYQATLELSTDAARADTYLVPAGWNKGYMWVNGALLGRYWESKGPQHAFYVPAPLLRPGANEILLFELDHANTSSYSISFRDGPLYYTGQPCSPTAAPPAPANLAAMWSCSPALNRTQRWTVYPSAIALTTDPTLCLQSGPAKDPQSGSPAVSLAKCDPSNDNQHFVYDASKLAFTLGTTGRCLDITSHVTTNGASVETYACNGGDNQQFVVDADSAHITTKMDGACLSLCT